MRISKEEIWIIAVLSVIYLFFSDGAYSWKDRALFAQTASIAEKGELNIDGIVLNDNFYPKFQKRQIADGEGSRGDIPDFFTGDTAKIDGKIYPLTFPGISILGSVPYSIIRAFGGCSLSKLEGFAFIDREPDGFSSPVLKGWPLRLTIFLSSGIFSVVAAILLYRICGSLFPGAALATALVYGLCSLNCFYATLYFQRQLATSLFVIAFYILFMRMEKLKMSAVLVSAGIFSYGVFSSYPDMVLVIPFFLYIFMRGRKKEAVVFAVASLAMSIALISAYNLMTTGNPLAFPHSFAHGLNPQHQKGFEGISLFPNIGAAVLNLIGIDRGFFIYTPFMLLSIPGLWLLCKDKEKSLRTLGFFIAFLVFVELWLYSAFPDWKGGVCFGQRYLLPASAFLMIPVGRYFCEARRSRIKMAVFAVLTLISFSIVAHGLFSKLQYFSAGDSILKAVFYQVYKDELRQEYMK